MGQKPLLIIAFMLFVGNVLAQSLSLSFHPIVGSCQKYEITKSLWIGQSGINRRTPDIFGNSTVYYLFSLKTIEDKGDYLIIEFVCDSISTSVESSIEFSANSYPMEYFQITDNPFKDKLVLMHISKTGEIFKILGIDYIVDQLETKQQSVKMASMVTSLVKELFRMAVPKYTDKLLTVGQEWNSSEQADAGVYRYREDIQYVLNDFDHEIAMISLLSTIEPDNNDEYDKGMMGQKMKIKPSGTVTGTQKIDRSTGWIIESMVQKSITVHIEMENVSITLPPSISREKITVKRM